MQTKVKVQLKISKKRTELEVKKNSVWLMLC